MFDKLIKIALNAALENPEIMKIKDTRKIEDFPVSTGNQRFPLDFQDAKNLRFLCIKERLRIKNEEVKINLMKQENKIIDIDKNSYKVME